MKNILVPTDFSPCSKYAAGAAWLLARRFGAKLHLLTCLGLPAKWDSMTAAERLADKEAQQTILQGETLLAEWKKQYPGIEVETHFTGKKLPEGVREYINGHGIDLVVMGSHGASGKSEYFIGSNTQKVVRTVHCPVLVVKNPLETVDFQKVVFASTFSEADLAAFRHFKDFIKHFVPEVHLVCVHTSPFDAPYPVLKEAMRPFEEACRPLVCKSHIYRDFSVEGGIRSFAKETGAELIAISNHERHPLKRMLVGSNVELLVNHSELPVLTIDF